LGLAGAACGITAVLGAFPEDIAAAIADLLEPVFGFAICGSELGISSDAMINCSKVEAFNPPAEVLYTSNLVRGARVQID
jgi:hypothetical protein